MDDMATATRDAEQRLGEVAWQRDVRWPDVPPAVRAAFARVRDVVALVAIPDRAGGGWAVRLNDGPAWITPDGAVRPLATDPPPSGRLRGMTYVDWNLGLAAGDVLVAIAVTYTVTGGGERFEDTGDWQLETRLLPDLADGPLRLAYAGGRYRSAASG